MAGEPAATPSLREAMARRAYGSPASNAPLDGAASIPDIDRRRTQLLAQAMAIRLERDQTALRLASANERQTNGMAAALTATHFADHSAVRGADRGAQDGADRGMDQGEHRPDRGLEHDRDAAGGRKNPDVLAMGEPATAQRFVLVPAGRAEAWARGSSQPVQAIETDAASAVSILSADIRSLRALVERIARSRADGTDHALAEAYLASPAPWSDAVDAATVGAPLAGFYATLIGHAMASDLAQRLISEAHALLSPQERLDSIAVRHALRNRVAALLPACEGELVLPTQIGRPHVISLVGPTGTGKTTTIAKLAANLSLGQGRRVGLVTTDTFRIAAVDQLRTYADIVGIPLEVAEGAGGVRIACQRFADRDVILIDTAGRSHADRERVQELGGLLQAARPDETHLVLSSTGDAATLIAQAQAFAPVGVDRVVLSKLDEAVGFGVLLAALGRIGQPMRWITTGQQVPEDIESARSERLAELVLGGVAG